MKIQCVESRTGVLVIEGCDYVNSDRKLIISVYHGVSQLTVSPVSVTFLKLREGGQSQSWDVVDIMSKAGQQEK